MSPTDADTAKLSPISRSVRSLRNAILGIGGAASASSLAALDAVARELTKAERRRRRRQREREEEREDEREERLRARRRRRDNDDDDDDTDRMDLIRARHAALSERSSGNGRRVTAAQEADGETVDRVAGGRQARRQEAQAESDETSEIDAAQVIDETDTRIDSGTETDTDAGSESAVIRVGNDETWASIDPETGTATATSNGVSAIAGPEGATIEGTSSGVPFAPAAPSDEPLDADGNDDGLGLPSPDGGDNGELPLS